MYTLQIESLSEKYDGIDRAMEDCFQLYPDADFSWWNSNENSSWIDIYRSSTDKTIIGKIVEVN